MVDQPHLRQYVLVDIWQISQVDWEITNHWRAILYVLREHLNIVDQEARVGTIELTVGWAALKLIQVFILQECQLLQLINLLLDIKLPFLWIFEEKAPMV